MGSHVEVGPEKDEPTGNQPPPGDLQDDLPTPEGAILALSRMKFARYLIYNGSYREKAPGFTGQPDNEEREFFEQAAEEKKQREKDCLLVTEIQELGVKAALCLKTDPKITNESDVPHNQVCFIRSLGPGRYETERKLTLRIFCLDPFQYALQVTGIYLEISPIERGFQGYRYALILNPQGQINSINLVPDNKDKPPIPLPLKIEQFGPGQRYILERSKEALLAYLHRRSNEQYLLTNHHFY